MNPNEQQKTLEKVKQALAAENMKAWLTEPRYSDIWMTMRCFKADLNDQVTAIEQLPPPTHPGQHLVSIRCRGERPEVAANGNELPSNAQKGARHKSKSRWPLRR
jgi:hypothetical protein